MSRLTPAALAAFFLASTGLASTVLASSALAQDQQASFACAKAKAPREIATCATPEARKADAEMAAAYSKWMRKLSAPQAAALQASQRQFNAYADRRCAVERVRKEEAREESSKCLAELMIDRTGFLDGLRSATANGMMIEPRVTTAFQIHRDDDGESMPQGWITNDAVPVLLGGSETATAAFSAEIRRMMNPDKALIAGRHTLIGSVTRSFTITYFTPKLLSLQVNEHVEAGTSVPDRDVGTNLDLTTGKPVPVEAVFTTGDAWRAAMADALRRDINRPEDLGKHLNRILTGGRDVIWSYGSDKVNVSWRGMYPPDESADVPLSDIARFIRPDSPWQPGNVRR